MGDFIIRPYSEILNGSVPKEGQLQIRGYENAVADLRRKHGRVLTNEALPSSRKPQVQFLEKVIELLKKTEFPQLTKLLCDSDKALVRKSVEQRIDQLKSKQEEELRQLGPKQEREVEQLKAKHQQKLKKLRPILREELVKGIIFTSLITVVLAEIAGSYKESIFDPRHVERTSTTCQGRLGGEGSDFFCGLLVSIGRNKENEMSFERVKLFMETAAKFMGTHVFEPHEHMDMQSAAGFKDEHEFSGIEGLNPANYLELCADVIQEAVKGSIKRNAEDLNVRAANQKREEQERIKQDYEEQRRKVEEKEREEQERKRQEKGVGMGSWFGGFLSSKTPPPSTDSSVTQDDSSVTEQRSETPVPEEGSSLNP